MRPIRPMRSACAAPEFLGLNHEILAACAGAIIAERRTRSPMPATRPPPRAPLRRERQWSPLSVGQVDFSHAGADLDEDEPLRIADDGRAGGSCDGYGDPRRRAAIGATEVERQRLCRRARDEDGTVPAQGGRGSGERPARAGKDMDARHRAREPGYVHADRPHVLGEDGEHKLAEADLDPTGVRADVCRVLLGDDRTGVKVRVLVTVGDVRDADILDLSPPVVVVQPNPHRVLDRDEVADSELPAGRLRHHRGERLHLHPRLRDVHDVGGVFEVGGQRIRAVGVPQDRSLAVVEQLRQQATASRTITTRRSHFEHRAKAIAMRGAQATSRGM